jgi:hypothetical protein
MEQIFRNTDLKLIGSQNGPSARNRLVTRHYTESLAVPRWLSSRSVEIDIDSHVLRPVKVIVS